MERPKSIADMNWQSIAAQAAPLRLTAIERPERFRLEAVTEVVLRALGILAIAFSILVVILQPFTVATGQTLSNGVLAAIFAATGLLIYAYGTRGFRRKFKLDTAAGTLTLTKLNVRGRSRMSRLIDIDEIESIFADRPAKSGGLAVLQLRLADSTSPVAVIGGQLEELRMLHDEMCDMINASRPETDSAADQKPKKPARPKPKLFASARA